MQRAYSLLPHIKITDLLIEVDSWTGFTNHFTHIKNGETAKDKILLLTGILVDAIYIGLRKIAESCSGTTYSKISYCRHGISVTKPIGLHWLNW